MRFNVISNLTNGIGLQRDYELLKAELERRGHVVRGVQFNAAREVKVAEVNVFLETVRKEFFQYAARQWVVPNPEWWGQPWDAIS